MHFLVGLYNRRRRFRYMHASVSGGRAYCTFCFLCLRRSIFADRKAVFSGDLYNRQRRFWYIMHASGSGGRAG